MKYFSYLAKSATAATHHREKNLKNLPMVYFEWMQSYWLVFTHPARTESYIRVQG